MEEKTNKRHTFNSINVLNNRKDYDAKIWCVDDAQNGRMIMPFQSDEVVVVLVVVGMMNGWGRRVGKHESLAHISVSRTTKQLIQTRNSTVVVVVFNEVVDQWS